MASTSVCVRLFAALREAAGVPEVEIPPGPLPVLLQGLADRFGEPFATRLSVASVLVDGERVGRDDPRDVPAGAEVALLPPFSGGSSTHGRRPRVRQVATAPALPVEAVAVALALVAARAVSHVAYEVVVCVATPAAALDLARLMTRAVARPLLPAAALSAAVLPVLAAVVGAPAWGSVPSLAAATLLLSFLLVLVAGRRVGVIEALSATLLAGILPGLGGASLVLLGDLDAGFRWVVATVGVTAVAVLGVGAVRWLRPRPPLVAELAAPLAAATAAAAGLTAVLGPPLALVPAARIVLAGAVGAVAVARLVALLRDEEGAARGPARGRSFTSVAALLLAAPVVHVIARITA